ncbi:receptor-type tyrosine-protein phosphatase V-like isoform X2 [Sapajus apella]|uniref:Receptor-type tyrosine-protein phosphatase V-like isoform X2 n=1 Tax=Sapajus apella TaxID=9515 RepID=A0A6J3IPQ6_SAPAP|nr:receptor-type tyrosine-protein phosphatase V-like isoform X2 [Sapajus apella]
MLPHTQGGAQDLCFQQAPSFRQSYEAKSAHAHQTFFLEFKELKEVGKEQPRLGTEHPPNTTENQYPHVLPYDTSRDRLT